MKLITLALILCGLGLTASAQTANLKTTDHLAWQKIAEITVPFENGEGGAEIPVYEKEKYGSIHFRVAEAQMELKTVKLMFDNEEKQDVVVNERLGSNKNSPVIDLVGDRRILKSVAFTYKSIPRTDDKKIIVQLWASKTTVAPSGKVYTRTQGKTKTATKKRVRN